MATLGKRDRLPRDQAFKAILSHPRMIADAVRGYAARPVGPLDPRTVAALDFGTLEKLPTEWITPDFRRRLGDQVWRVRFRWARDWSDPGGYLLVLVEFQSRREPDMALRMANYALRLCAELATVRVVQPGGPRPPILPLLIHNGRGALDRIHHARRPDRAAGAAGDRRRPPGGHGGCPPGGPRAGGVPAGPRPLAAVNSNT